MWIDDIQKIRTKNNELWMDILRLAFKHAPEESKDIMKQITENDKKVSEITAKV